MYLVEHGKLGREDPCTNYNFLTHLAKDVKMNRNEMTTHSRQK